MLKSSENGTFICHSFFSFISVSYRDLEITIAKIRMFSSCILFFGPPLSLSGICNVFFKLYTLFTISVIYILARGRKQISLIPKATIPTIPMDHQIHILLNALLSYLLTNPLCGLIIHFLTILRFDKQTGNHDYVDCEHTPKYTFNRCY